MSLLRIPNLEKMTREEREELATRFVQEALSQEQMADSARAERERLAHVQGNAVHAAYTLRQLARAARAFDSVPQTSEAT